MKFSRQYRLLKPAEFRSVFKQSIRSDDRCFKVLAGANGFGRHRLGMAISKKTCNRAVDRNRVKRVIRESFRNHLAGNQTENALDFVVMSKAGAQNNSNAELSLSLEGHWHRLMAGAGSRHTRTTE